MKHTLLFFIGASILLAGCAGADVMILDPSRTFKPTENVLLLLEVPSRPYEMIAIIEGVGTQYNNESEVVRAAQKKAGKIGAHAIIPIESESKEVAPQIMPNPVAGGQPLYIAGGTRRTIKYAAIRFID